MWSESQTKAAEVPLRNVSRFRFAARSILLRLSSLQMSGICIGDLGNLLYADYSNGGVNREQAVQELGQSLSSLSAQWFVMLDTGFFHVVRTADVLANLPLEPQVQMQGNRYVAVPLLPIILHGSTDYAGVALNLAEDKNTAFLRAVAYGACPAFVWSFENKTEEDENPLYFEYQLDNAVNNYTRANTALRGLRGLRITDYQYDGQSKVSVTTFG